MKHRSYLHSCAAALLPLAAVLCLTCLPTAQAKPGADQADGTAAAEKFVGERKPTKAQETVARAVASWLQRRHYTNRKITDEVSRTLFNEYFRALDPNKVYFLAEDLRAFSPYKLILDELLERGKLRFAFDVYERFLQRVKERSEYVDARLQRPFDFDKDEQMLIDREDLPWAADRQALNQVWDQRIKNQVLLERLKREQARKEGDKLPAESVNESVSEHFRTYYNQLNAYDTHDVVGNFLTTLAHIFDPHSDYWNWRRMEDFDISMRLQLQGIGAVLRQRGGYTEVVSIVPGGPAAKDGRLKPQHQIIGVGQAEGEIRSVVNMPLYKVVRLIRGEKGTRVRLRITKSSGGIPKDIAIVRDVVELEDSAATGSVKSKTTADGRELPVGYINLPSFYVDWDAQREGDPNARSATGDVRKLVEEMIENDKIEALIIDLRSNGGGSLPESISLAGLFIPNGPVVQVHQADGEVNVKRDDDNGLSFDLPLVLLTSHASASASEIFAGAMQDYGRAVLIGSEQTHGKGTVQQILRMRRYPGMRDLKPGALKYTMAKFYRVTGHSTQFKGVVPDIVMPSFYDHMDIGERSLDHALPWDEIEPCEYEPVDNSVSRYLPRLKARSAERREQNEDFQKLVKEIQRYGKRQQENQVPLNYQARLERWQQDQKWSDRITAIFDREPPETDDDTNELDKQGQGPEETPQTNGDDADQEDDDTTDFVLQEGLAVAADLCEMIAADREAEKGAAK